MRRHIAYVLGLPTVAALCALSCDEGPRMTTTEMRGGAELAEELAATGVDDRSVILAMHEDYRAAADVVDAIVAGDLGRAAASAWDLAIPPDASRIPDSWEPWAEGVRIHAADIIVEDDPSAAAGHAAALLEQCGACHTAAAALIPFEREAEPAAASGSAARMMLHAWAADRLAEGLVGPSDQRWIAGAEALAVAPLVPESVAGGDDPWLADAKRLAEEVGEIARVARDMKSPAQRRAAYASYLETCVACHTLFRAGSTEARP